MTTVSFSSAFLLTVRMRFLLPALLLSALLLNACAQSERNDGLPDGPILLPTLDLIPIEEPLPDLSARIIDQQNGVNIHSFTNEEAAAGFLAPPDEHILFLSPADLAQGMEVQTVHGSPTLWNEVRYWGYEYSGNEEANRGAGKTGRALFDGRFWLSQGERNVTQALYGYLHTPGPNGAQMHMTGNKLYYLMVDGGAGVSGNPGLQGRPFVVCTGERNTCNMNILPARSSAQTSSADSSTLSASSPVSSTEPDSSAAISSAPAPGSSAPTISCLTESIIGVTGPDLLAKGDLDGDGDEDIAVLSNVLAGAGYQTVSILQNNQDSFQVLTEYTSPTPYRGLALGDFDGDGLPDLALTYGNMSQMAIYINPGDGNFFASQPMTISGSFGVFDEIVTGDVNGDGYLDLVVGGSFSNGGHVFLGSDTLTFTQGPRLGQTGGNQYHPSLVDVNLDGHLDFVATPHGGTSSTELQIFINDGAGNFAAPQSYVHQTDNPYTNVLLFGDINEDGFVDIIQFPNAHDSILGWINDGDGTFSKTLFGPVRGRDGALADLNGDGHLDSISGTYTQPNYQFLLGNGDGTFTEVIWTIAATGRDMLTGDFDGDGTLDFVQGMAESGNEIRLVKNIASCFSPPASAASSVASSAVSSTSASVVLGTCGDGVCDQDRSDGSYEGPAGCDPTIEAPDLCDGYVFCPEDCAAEDGSVCGNGIPESGEMCDDGATLAGGDCSADCQCAHWERVATFMNTHCSNATNNLESKECYLAILSQWNGVVPGTPPAIPDIDCSGTGDTDDVIDLLTPLILVHYPEGA